MVSEGAVTGVATPRHPQALTSPAQLANIPVTVTISAGGMTIATQTVTGSHNYRFVVAPGLYQNCRRVALAVTKRLRALRSGPVKRCGPISSLTVCSRDRPALSLAETARHCGVQDAPSRSGRGKPGGSISPVFVWAWRPFRPSENAPAMRYWPSVS